MALKHSAVLAGLRPVRGSGRLVGARLLLLVLCFLPTFAMTRAAITQRHGSAPTIIDRVGPLSFGQANSIVRSIAGDFIAWAALGFVVFLLFDQLLTASALVVLKPTPPEPTPVRLWRTLWSEGRGYLGRFVRILLVAVVLDGLGVYLLRILFDWLGEHGNRVGWTGLTSLVVLPALEMLCATLWFALVGAFSFWCQVVTVADERQRVRRTALVALRLFRRRAVRGPLFFLALTLGVQLVGGVAIVLLSGPASSFGATVRLLLWIGFLLVHAGAWHWLIRAGHLLYGGPGLADLRDASDEPFGLLGWLRRRWRRRV